MKLNQLRKNGELVLGIRDLMNNQYFKVLLEMLEDEHPRRGDLGAGATVYDVARLHDRQVAYELCLDNMRKAGEFIMPVQDMKQDYEAEPETEQ